MEELQDLPPVATAALQEGLMDGDACSDLVSNFVDVISDPVSLDDFLEM